VGENYGAGSAQVAVQLASAPLSVTLVDAAVPLQSPDQLPNACGPSASSVTLAPSVNVNVQVFVAMAAAAVKTSLSPMSVS